MVRVKRDNWFIKGNDFSISLMRFYVCACMYSYDGKIGCVMNVMDDDNNKTFFFDELESAFKFTEEHVANCNNIEEVINEYNEFIKKPKTYRKK